MARAAHVEARPSPDDLGGSSDDSPRSSMQAVEMLGYTPRQAQFLVPVAYTPVISSSPVRGLHGYAAWASGCPLLSSVRGRAHVRTLPYGRQGHVYHL